MNNDLINGLFEGVGAIVVWFNVVCLYKDKEIKGILLSVSTFFAVWSLWNLYYYPSLNQIVSFIGGIFLAIGTWVWLIMAFKYKYFQTGKFEIWEYGTCNDSLARRHKIKRNVQMKLWKVGDIQGKHIYTEDFWYDFHESWWKKFKKN